MRGELGRLDAGISGEKERERRAEAEERSGQVE